ncbi:MAG: pyruvate dehydrogenase (acetyl-transferring), homodimeric type, partial [Gammaproteobacteria bacterium]|nr:pyruvate dehydrogenase (acetyl-transferring), homodimeric type [Gammaproteobacteria bacterium]NNM13838.1 pyruvate dehydrogenase (acetyl-transferring), homodimeric type [Gammaproteobacteria bacterium]
KLSKDDLVAFRDRFNIPVSDAQIDDLPFVKPEVDSAEMKYFLGQREKLGGSLPQRSDDAPKLEIPALDIFKAQLAGTGEREISTTMAFVRMLTALTRDKKIGKNIVPIVPDEARTFGMEGMFRQIGIYSSKGQLYEPQDADQLMYYREDKSGQILEEGINEAGSACSWIAAGTAYANYGVSMIPFYIYYSMFGFQRIGDFVWAGADMQTRGFLMGGTAGRTTLAGEGLQHQDGHSLVLSSTIPNCISYDPCYAYELAVIIHDGLRRMYAEQENVFYYLTCMNENYAHPAMPEGAEQGILKGMYKLKQSDNAQVQLMGSGTILREVEKAAEILAADYNINSDIWSVTSFSELRRDGLSVERWNALHPDETPKQSFVSQSLQGLEDQTFVVSTDYMKVVPDQIRQWIPGDYHVLGTDGFGRSDDRRSLRRYFEVDAEHVVVTTLYALQQQGKVKAEVVKQAIKKYGIDPERVEPDKG